jgi:hypothetical protein
MWTKWTVGEAATEIHVVVEGDIFLERKKIQKNTVSTSTPVYLD